ncbi:MAG: type II secretion system F family protein [Candidatus Pacebacteria bacterium]|nr:type II secretion system F family protein [Candidatus Paceibacterota bacterium]
MPIYRYKARDAEKGRVARGNIVAFNESDVKIKLAKKNLSVEKLTEVTHNLESKILLFINPVKAKDLVIFFRQFSVMITANVTIVESLITLVDQTKNISLQKLISEIAYEVDSGALLSDAMAKRKSVFGEFYINIIRSGETSGKLDEVLNYLADEIEKSYEMTAKIKNAMIYPAFIISGLVAVGIVMMVFVIPKLTSVLQETGTELPLSTKIVIAVANFMEKYIIYILIVAAGLGVAFRYFLKSTLGRKMFDYFQVQIPIFGKLFKLIYIVRFTRSLSTLLKGGVSITKSLDISAKVVRNHVYQVLIYETLAEVSDGNSITSAFEGSKYMPNMVTHMMAIGERAGKLDDVLDTITDFYSKEINNMLANLTTILEPLIMIVMAVGVGIMVAAVILPMYNLAGNF